MSAQNDLNAAIEYEDTMQPKFILADFEEFGEPSKHLYIQTFSDHPTIQNKWISRPVEEWHRLVKIQRDSISVWPVFTAVITLRYLKPRHGSIERLIYVTRPLPALPDTLEEAIRYLNIQLSGDLFNNLEWGSGFVKELDAFIEAIRPLGRVQSLAIIQGGNPSYLAEHLNVEETTLLHFLRVFERMKRKARNEVKLARNWIVRNNFLPRVDPKRFVRVEQVRNGSNLLLLETRRSNSNPTAAESRRERRSSISSIKSNLQQLASEEPRELLQLRADIEKVTLDRMIERFDEKLKQNLTEPHWQRFFEDNTFILSLLFARPVKLLHSQFHAQPSHLAGNGAQIGDFLFTEYGQALAIVEIKKPSTDLTTSSPYRNTEIYGPSSELSAAITQVLYQNGALKMNWLSHQYGDEGLRNSGPESVGCFVIAGTYPQDEARKRSFELYRDALKNVVVITFDELRQKLALLQRHLTSPANDGNEIPF